MGIQAFGYLGIGSARLDDWSAFATGQMTIIASFLSLYLAKSWQL